MVTPMIEFPLILERKGNPYKWVSLHPDADTLNVPKLFGEGANYIFTGNGDCYDLVWIDANTPLVKLSCLNFTHWFTKPIKNSDILDNHICPICMDYGVEYLVRIKEKWHFISTESLLRDHLPIKYWVKETELFPIR